jgi:glutaredoxin
MAREYLKSKKVDFKEFDISENPKAAAWVQDHIGQLATPVLDINGIVVLGFDREKIDLALHA